MKNRKIEISFICGFVTALSLFSLYQDYLGLEGSIKCLTEHWVSGYVTVPLALITLTLSLFYYFGIKNKK